jgi:hypothetical protein
MTTAEVQTPDAPKPTEDADRGLTSDGQNKGQLPTSGTELKEERETSPTNTAAEKPAEGAQETVSTPTKVTAKQADTAASTTNADARQSRPLPIRTASIIPPEIEKPMPPSPKKPPVAAPSTDNISDPPPYRPRDTYIAIIGETGVGKTTFIKDVTGLDLVVGDDLESCERFSLYWPEPDKCF